jgi:hypothetical protein
VKDRELTSLDNIMGKRRNRNVPPSVKTIPEFNPPKIPKTVLPPIIKENFPKLPERSSAIQNLFEKHGTGDKYNKYIVGGIKGNTGLVENVSKLTPNQAIIFSALENRPLYSQMDTDYAGSLYRNLYHNNDILNALGEDLNRKYKIPAGRSEPYLKKLYQELLQEHKLDSRLSFGVMPTNVQGGYSPISGNITLNKTLLGNPNLMSGVLAHEMQHAKRPTEGLNLPFIDPVDINKSLSFEENTSGVNRAKTGLPRYTQGVDKASPPDTWRREKQVDIRHFGIDKKEEGTVKSGIKNLHLKGKLWKLLAGVPIAGALMAPDASAAVLDTIIPGGIESIGIPPEQKAMDEAYNKRIRGIK